MERAYDDAKYGHFSKKPYIDMIIPTLVDPSMAPPGKHVISCFVQYAPYKLAPELGTWDDQREAFGDAVIDRIAEFAPNIRDVILHRNVQTPLDIERTTGLSEGNIFQGELSLEQLFFNRPVPGYARFRTPIRDLWLCGSATHPGRRDHGRERPDRRDGGPPGPRPEGRLTDGERVRRRRRRRRPQRPRHGRVSREGRPSDARPRAARNASAARPRRRRSAARACRGWPTRSAGCGRRSSAISTFGRTACGSSRRTSASSPRSPTAGRSRSGRTRHGRSTGCAPGRPATPIATRTSIGSSARSGRFLGEIAGQTPPDIKSPGLGDALAGLKLGRTFRGLGKRDAHTILRVLPMAVADFVAEAFETDAVQAAIAWRGVAVLLGRAVVGGDDRDPARRLGRQRRRSGRPDGVRRRRARAPCPTRSRPRRRRPAPRSAAAPTSRRSRRGTAR